MIKVIYRIVADPSERGWGILFGRQE
jgi:hypothetical protein